MTIGTRGCAVASASDRQPVPRDPSGTTIGVFDKYQAHDDWTPIHIDLSCYIFTRV